jgi:hypothetical protein
VAQPFWLCGYGNGGTATPGCAGKEISLTPPLPKRGLQAKFNIIRKARANCKFWGNFYFAGGE